jgi:hypothetical protein
MENFNVEDPLLTKSEVGVDSESKIRAAEFLKDIGQIQAYRS